MMSDLYLQQHVRLENLKAGEAREIVKLMLEVQKKFIDRLESASTQWSRERLLSQIATYERILDQIYDKGILPKLQKDGLDFVAKYQAYQYNALATTVEGSPAAAVVTANVAPSAIYQAATAKPMQGKLMGEWARQLKAKEKNKISAILQEAWLSGETTGDASKQIQAVMRGSRRDAATITRTFYSHLASETQRSVWEENSDIVQGVTWDATLDNRTTLNICAPRDQLDYTLDGEPIGHNLPWIGGPGQAHWNCRSTALPMIEGIDDTVQRRAVSAGKNYESGDNITRTGKVRKNSADARKKGIYKQQTVRPDTTYSDWLKRQPAAFQNDVLGIEKGKAFRRGDWKLGEKFTPQNPTTLEDF